MLLFRGEEHIDRWCRSWVLPKGEAFSTEQAWTLASGWYGDRLEAGWCRKTVEEAQALLSGIGLRSAFWQLA
jgi:hypothetical protein